MPVFISYTRANEETPLLINRRFNSAGVSTYLDLLDPNIPAAFSGAPISVSAVRGAKRPGPTDRGRLPDRTLSRCGSERAGVPMGSDQ